MAKNANPIVNLREKLAGYYPPGKKYYVDK